MKPIKVNKKDVIETMCANREKHRDLFLKAQDGYRKVVIEAFEKRLNDVRDGKKRIDLEFLDLRDGPVDRTGDYDKAIGMLRLSVEDIVELDARDYQQFILDQWEWSDFALTSNTKYSNMR